MKKILISAFTGLLLVACGDKIESPMELVKTTTLKDTLDFCMKVNGNREYCNCEIGDLSRTFPWDTYMNAIDALGGSGDYVAAVMEKHGGSRKKVLAELNCKDCIFERALVAVNVSPSPRCAGLLK